MSVELSFKNCQLCPRNCQIDRYQKVGFCGVDAHLKVSLATLHFGEEPPLVGQKGSGTIFFNGCQLRCAFCQNWQISRNCAELGQKISSAELATIMLELEKQGAANINLVSATPFLPHVLVAIKIAKNRGLTIPFVWNSGGYDSLASLKLLEDDVKIYLPDFKTTSPELAKKLYLAPNYVEICQQTILALIEKHPLAWDKNDNMLLSGGVIIRHLVLPDQLEDSYQFLKWYAAHAKGRALLSLLTQYTPVSIPGEKRAIPKRYLNRAEEELLITYLTELDINDGYFQDLVPSSDWLPDFQKNNPFSSKLAKTIWHSV